MPMRGHALSLMTASPVPTVSLGEPAADVLLVYGDGPAEEEDRV